MQERILSATNMKYYQFLQTELTRLRQENEQFRHKLRKLRKQSTKDKAVITYLGRVTPSTGLLQTQQEPFRDPLTGLCHLPPESDAFKRGQIEMQSKRKRKRITTDSDYSDRYNNSDTNITLSEKIKQLRKDNRVRDSRLRWLEATVDKVIEENHQNAIG
jgi:hypothetical protein